MNNLEIQKEKWNKDKQKGKKKYILIHGVLKLIVISIFFATFNIFVYDTSLLNSNRDIIVTFSLYAIVYSLIGILYGNRMWNINSKKFDL